MIAVDRWADILADLRPVRLDPNRCLPLSSAKAPCNACVTLCPNSAIMLGQPTLPACDTCGLCAAVCHADAILLNNPSDQELLQRLASLSRRYDRVLFTCGPTHDESMLHLGCLGRLSPEMLLATAACGFRQIDLVTCEAGCTNCPKEAGLKLTMSALLEAQAALDHLGQPCVIRLTGRADPVERRTEGSHAQQPVYEDRRAFLLSALGLLRAVIPLTAAPHPTPPTTNSRRRELLLWALSHLPVDHQATVAWGKKGLALRTICHHCGVCTSLCPNGALHLVQETLALDPQRCHSCGLCTQLCPIGAIGFGPPRSLAAIAAGGAQPLGHRASLTCSRCATSLQATLPAGDAPAEPLCLACQIRRASKQEVFLS